MKNIIAIVFTLLVVVSPSFCEENERAAKRDDSFVGKWRVLNDKGGVFYTMTLEPLGKATRTEPFKTGEWEVVAGEARLTWSDGWRDILRADKVGFSKHAFKPGMDWADKPHDVYRCSRIPILYKIVAASQDSVVLGATTYGKEDITIAVAIIDAQAQRQTDIAAAERELKSIKNAKIVSGWSKLYEKHSRPDFGRVISSPDDYVVVHFKSSAAQRIKDYGVRDTEFRINEIRGAMKDFDEGRYAMPPMPDLVVGEFKTGRIGNLKSPNGSGAEQPYKVEAKLLQVLTESDALVKMFEETVWLKGISTKDLTDGKSVAIAGTYRVLGTKQYRAVVGTNTVFVIEPFSVSRELVKHLQSPK